MDMPKKIRDFFISILGWGVGIICTAFLVFFAFLSLIFDPFNRNLLAFIKNLWGKLITKIGVKELIVIGGENIKNLKGTMFVSNHQSIFDVYILSALTPAKTSFLSKKEVLYVPLFGILMKFQGCVFIDRKNSESARKGLMEVINKLKKGFNFIIFPEGTRSKDGKLQPFKPGILKIVNRLKDKTSIVPVTIIGTHKIMKKGSFILNRGKVVVVFSEKFPSPEGEMTFDEGNVYLKKLRDVILKNLDKYSEYN